MITYTPLTIENLDEAIRLQALIFPHEKDADFLRSSCLNDQKEIQNLFNFSELWLIKQKDIPVGLTGLHSYTKYPQDVWMNWFGILPEYRGKGIGRQALEWTIAQAKKKGFPHVYLYSEIGDNDVAIAFYRYLNFFEEPYTAEKEIKNMLIFRTSTVATALPPPLWNNKNLYLYEQTLEFNRLSWNFIKKTPTAFIRLMLTRPFALAGMIKRCLFNKT